MTKLLDHNQKTYDEVKEFIDKGLNCCVVNPCGSGKTSIMSKIIEDHPDNSFVIITKQKNAENYYKSKNKVFSRSNVIIRTYNKMHNDFKKAETEIYNTDFMLIDEAHYIGAPLWNDAFDYITNKYHQKLIGFTATPQRYEDQGTNKNIVTDFFDSNAAGRFSTKDLQKQGVFVEPEYVLSIYNLKNMIDSRLDKIYESDIDDEEKKEIISKLDEAYDKWTKESNPYKVLSEYLPKFMYKEKCNRILVYVEDVKQLSKKKKFVETTIKDIFKDKSVISYTYTYKSSEDELRKFLKDDARCDIKILFSIDKIMETVHIDDLRIMIMLRPSDSSRIITQQFGRVNNITNRNRPLIIDMVDNLSNLRNINISTHPIIFKSRNNYNTISVSIPHVSYYNSIFEKVDSQLSKYKYYTYKGFTGTLIDICNVFCKNVNSVIKLMKDHTLYEAMMLATNEKYKITQAILDEESIVKDDFKLTAEQKVWAENNLDILDRFFERYNIKNEDWKQELYMAYLQVISKYYEDNIKQRILNRLKKNYIILFKRSIMRKEVFTTEDIEYIDENNFEIDDSMLNNVANSELREIFEELLNGADKFRKRSKQILRLRFGFEDGRVHTYEYIGKITICFKDYTIGVNREVIRHIEAAALRWLRHPKRARRIEDFLD